MHYHIYCDESSTTTGTYMVIGGIIFPANNDASIRQGISDKKNELGLIHEVSWDSISKSVVDRYIKLIDYFFYLIENGKICFKAIIVDKTQYDNKRYRNVNDTPFYKMYFQLLYHKFCKVWHSKNEQSKFIVMPDEKSSNISLLNLKDYLNNSIKYFLSTSDMVSDIIPQISKDSEVIQIVDLYIGCLSYFKNDYHLRPDASKSKIAFLNHVINKLQNEDVCENTRKKDQKYEIWNILFKTKIKAPNT